MKRVLLLLYSLLFAVSSVEAKHNHRHKHNHLDSRGLDEQLCRCEASYEDLYDEVNEDFYVIDGIRVLPRSDTACSSGDTRHLRLKVSRVQRYCLP
jgi:hypothetical protein